jgi:hypothetical protein
LRAPHPLEAATVLAILPGQLSTRLDTIDILATGGARWAAAILVIGGSASLYGWRTRPALSLWLCARLRRRVLP